MEFTGRYEIPAPVEASWEALNDPEILKHCIPGCEEIEKVSPTEFHAVAVLKIGPVKARFRGKVQLSEMEPPHRCTLSGEGQGGVAGFAKGSAKVNLAPEDGRTVLTYSATASVGGKLAQIGQRLIDGAARQIADDFFGRFSAALSGGASPALEADPAVEARPDPPPPARRPQRVRMTPEIWIVGLIGVIAILLIVLGTVL
jgi:carbon monoxide dehydrogenase subunit G